MINLPRSGGDFWRPSPAVPISGPLSILSASVRFAAQREIRSAAGSTPACFPGLRAPRARVYPAARESRRIYKNPLREKGCHRSSQLHNSRGPRLQNATDVCQSPQVLRTESMTNDRMHTAVCVECADHSVRPCVLWIEALPSTTRTVHVVDTAFRTIPARGGAVGACATAG